MSTGPASTGTGAAASGTSTVAWIPLDCQQNATRFCDLSLTELPSGRTRTVPTVPGTFGFLGGGAFFGRFPGGQWGEQFVDFCLFVYRVFAPLAEISGTVYIS
jgi:hypothetical protein